MFNVIFVNLKRHEYLRGKYAGKRKGLARLAGGGKWDIAYVLTASPNLSYSFAKISALDNGASSGSSSGGAASAMIWKIAGDICPVGGGSKVKPCD